MEDDWGLWCVAEVVGVIRSERCDYRENLMICGVCMKILSLETSWGVLLCRQVS